MARKTRRSAPPLVAAHLGGIQRTLLEGDKRPAFLAYLDSHLPAKQGISALYDKKGGLYYAGKASDLPSRLNQHLKDRHGDSWDRMTLFMVERKANVGQLEAVVVAAARPPGNRQKPKIGQDLRRSLRQYLKKDAAVQIDAAVYPDKEGPADALAKRMTTKKLQKVSQARLATVLGISQPRVSHLFKQNAIRQYIREAGKRDAVLLLLQKAAQ